jgi:hypothetical protein
MMAHKQKILAFLFLSLAWVGVALAHSEAEETGITPPPSEFRSGSASI